MGYHVVDPADLDPEPDRPSDTFYVSEAAGMETLGLRTYDGEPGEGIPLSGMHSHDEQEAAFHVIEGTFSVETPGEVFEVQQGQFFVAEPESPHRAHNPADAEGPVRVIGIGAPPVSDGQAYEG